MAHSQTGTHVLKSIVHYYKNLMHDINLGGKAFIHPVDHPDTERVSNTTWVFTSKVISHDPDTGEFETLNTKYVPKE